MNRITKVAEGSIAEEMEIEVGDILLSINEKPVEDILDFMYLTQDDFIVVEIQKEDGEIWELEIEKDYDEALGIEFENPIMDCAKSCSNKCVFCFIDQLPKGMRSSLYFKDDDSRLSFLQGNFVTLTNLKEKDIDRIIAYRISPINVSVHTTNPELRVQMLNNKFANAIMERLKKLTENGIVVNAQIVLCPEYNDGEELERTLSDLETLYPGLNSVAIVPIGKTKFREGLLPVKSVDKQVAQDTIMRVNRFQKQSLEKYGSRFAFLADEFYIKAESEFPSHEAYEGYLQFEDGVGMVRCLENQLNEALLSSPEMTASKRVAVITGVAAYPSVMAYCEKVQSQYPNLKIDVHRVVNEFFGEEITVVGLLTGTDIKKVVLHPETDYVLLSESVFRADETTLLDDITLEQLSKHFKTPIYKVENHGARLLSCLLYGGKNE